LYYIESLKEQAIQKLFIAKIKVLMTKIIYVFANNRKENYQKNHVEAKDFYYGLHAFEDEKEYDIDIIELSNDESNKNYFLKFIDRFFQKILSLPFYSSQVTSLKNLNKFQKADKIIMVNESVGCSMLIILIILKIFKKVKVSLFVMGLYSKHLRFPILRFAHNFFIRFTVYFIDNMFFLGNGELKKAKKIHKNHDKLIYFPFCVDTEFWKHDINKQSMKQNDIIFVGNDSQRNFDLLIQIAKELPNYKFIFVSNNSKLDGIKLANVKCIKGSWKEKDLSDSDLKNLYTSSKVSIIPLHNSTQPSGQSVALQSMSLGIPVLISNTEGFWDKDLFEHEKDLVFVDPSDLRNWVLQIESIINDESKQGKIVANAKNKVLSNYNLHQFHKNLLKYF